MPRPFGGATPLTYQDSRFTAEAPTGTTAAAPVIKDRVYRLIGGVAADASAYKMVASVAADTPTSTILCVALEGKEAADAPVGVLVLNPYGGMTVILTYTGAAPTLGQSIAVSATPGLVTGAAWARGNGTIVKIDTATTTVEVIFS